MPAITLKALPGPLHRQLKARAARNKRSLNQEVIAVVLRRLSPQPTEYGVKTVDGTCYAVTAVGLEENEIVVQEALLGRFKIPIHELSEVRRKFRRG